MWKRLFIFGLSFSGVLGARMLYWWRLAHRTRDARYHVSVAMQRILVTVLPQDPLVDGVPNGTFARHLDEAATVRRFLLAGGYDVTIFVAGNEYGDRSPGRSIAEAGFAYLLVNHEIHADAILGDDAIRRYARKNGSYNAADGIFVASCLYKGGTYDSAFFVSDAQHRNRVLLTSIRCGILPSIWTISVAQTQPTLKDVMGEQLATLYTLLFDASWQGASSLGGYVTRRQHKPRT